MSVTQSRAQIKDRLNKNPRFQATIQKDPVRDAYLAQRAEERRQVFRQIMALLVMGAEQDANPVQKQKLAKQLPRLLRQFRHTGDPTPVLKCLERIMFTGYRPKDPQIREHLDKLEATLA